MSEKNELLLALEQIEKDKGIKKEEMKDTSEITMKNGRKAMKGKCPDCGTGMFKILGK